MEVLAPYIESGVVVHHDWPGFPRSCRCSTTASSAIATTRAGSRSSTWTSSCSPPPCGRSPRSCATTSSTRRRGELHDVRHVGSRDPAAGAGDRELPAPHRPRRPQPDHQEHRRPGAHAARGPHAALLPAADHERAVTERHEPIVGDESDSLSCELLRINHYFTRSQQERDAKIASRRADNGLAKSDGSERDGTLNAVEDRTILSYLPALREALGRRGARPPRAPAGTARLRRSGSPPWRSGTSRRCRRWGRRGRSGRSGPTRPRSRCPCRAEVPRPPPAAAAR